MRTIWTIASKDLVQLTRDRMGMFFILGFPVAMAFFFGIIGASMQSDSARLSVAVVDEDGSAQSRKLIEQLAASGQVAVERLERDEAVDGVRRGKLVGVVVVPKGFGGQLGFFWNDPPRIGLGVDPSRKAESAMLQGLVLEAVGQLTFARLADPETFRPLLAEAREKIAEDARVSATLKPLLAGLLGAVDQLLETTVAEQRRARDENPDAADSAALPALQLVRFEPIDVVRRDRASELLGKLRSPWDISFPQAMLWGVLGCVAGFAISIVRERTQGTWVRLRLAPISMATIIGGKTVACFLAVLGVIGLLTLLGFAVGMRPRSPGLLVLAALANAICFVGLMMTISALGRTEEAVSGGAWGINLIMAMFGGGMVPLAFLPGFMQRISDFSPVKWGVLALEGAIWRGFTFQEMLVPCAILMAIGISGFGCGVWLLKRD